MRTIKQYAAADNDYDQDNWIDETPESEGAELSRKAPAPRHKDERYYFDELGVSTFWWAPEIVAFSKDFRFSFDPDCSQQSRDQSPDEPRNCVVEI